MVELMQPGESVLKALRRLGGGKGGSSKASASQRWKTKKQKTGTETTVNTEDLNKLTGFADLLLQVCRLFISICTKIYVYLGPVWILFRLLWFNLNKCSKPHEQFILKFAPMPLKQKTSLFFCKLANIFFLGHHPHKFQPPFI